ncbi:hypothetical protein RRG08_023990 [Elysia crispata]|uniref:Uncharacterized protein n=1 Tax=Elysia crispata TaxID=231223 RepID=A0AAE0YMU9_9GAST|nr:hypothetical protein RRG08_023990 [Elysia crispata]
MGTPRSDKREASVCGKTMDGQKKVTYDLDNELNASRSVVLWGPNKTGKQGTEPVSIKVDKRVKVKRRPDTDLESGKAPTQQHELKLPYDYQLRAKEAKDSRLHLTGQTSSEWQWWTGRMCHRDSQVSQNASVTVVSMLSDGTRMRIGDNWARYAALALDHRTFSETNLPFDQGGSRATLSFFPTFLLLLPLSAETPNRPLSSPINMIIVDQHHSRKLRLLQILFSVKFGIALDYGSTIFKS